MKQHEYKLQKSIAQYLDLHNYLWCASAGGVHTSMKQAIKMKKSGYKKGFPDIFIYEPNDKYYGLAIELKVKGNYATKYQKKWLNELNKRNFYACVCTGIDETIEIINKYINNGL